MRLIIDIPEITCQEVRWRGLYLCPRDSDALVTAIRNGKPYEERPHGEWHTIPNSNFSPFDSTSEVIYMCSQCSYSSGKRIAANWNFCPNCGADMRKRGEAK